MIFRFTKDMRRQTVSNVFIAIPLEEKKILNVDLQPWEKKYVVTVSNALVCWYKYVDLQPSTSLSYFCPQKNMDLHHSPHSSLCLHLSVLESASLSLSQPSLSCYHYPPPLYASVSYYHYPPPFCASVHTLYKIISS